MLNTARGSSDDKTNLTLNHETFARALSNDVQLWDWKNYEKFSLNYDDVYETSSASKKVLQNLKVPMAPIIDSSAETIHSKTLLVLLWACFLISFFAFFYQREDFLPECDSLDTRGTWSENKGDFGCKIAWSILRWLYIVVVMGYVR